MINVVGIKFSDSNKIYYFNSLDIVLNKSDYVLVETEVSLQLGYVIIPSHYVSEEDLGKNLKLIIRKATKKDIEVFNGNIIASKDALIKAKKIALKLGTNLNLIDAFYNFDRSQLLFHFLADSRVDFRELAKKLAQNFHTRIELRQIGVRDKSKMTGGLGPCGRFLCCSSFLTEFNSVSINMAKNQMLALNPSKINGMCGRLLCCLEYEDDTYTEIKKNMPSLGSIYKNNDIEGKVISLNILKNTINIETKNKTIIEVSL